MRNRTTQLVVGATAMVIVLFEALPSPLYAQLACNEIRTAQAQSRYDLGLFDEVFGLLEPCLPDGFEDRGVRMEAYRLMALSRLALDEPEEARMWVDRLVGEDPNYPIDPEVDPPLFAEMIQKEKPAWYSWLWRGKAWYHWAGRAAIVGAGVSIPLLLRKQTEPDLPLPPDFPDPPGSSVPS
jgi:hypothetical protein